MLLCPVSECLERVLKSRASIPRWQNAVPECPLMNTARKTHRSNRQMESDTYSETSGDEG